MDFIRVMLVDDHPVSLAGLRSMLAELGKDRITVIAEAASGEDAIALAAEVLPHVVMMDIALVHGGLNGMQASRKIREANPHIKVILFSFHDEPAFVREFSNCLANGFVHKSASSEEIVNAICEVHAGKSFVSPVLASVLPAATRPGNELTPQEEVVFRYVVQGKTTKEIARQMELSVKTVAKHRENVSRKLNVHSPAAWIQYAIAQGIIDPALAPKSPKPEFD